MALFKCQCFFQWALRSRFLSVRLGLDQKSLEKNSRTRKKFITMEPFGLHSCGLIMRQCRKRRVLSTCSMQNGDFSTFFRYLALACPKFRQYIDFKCLNFGTPFRKIRKTPKMLKPPFCILLSETMAGGLTSTSSCIFSVYGHMDLLKKGTCLKRIKQNNPRGSDFQCIIPSKYS